MAFNPYPNRGFNRFGMVRGEGQLREGSPYLDRPQPQNQTQPEDDPVRMEEERRRKNMAAALAGQGRIGAIPKSSRGVMPRDPFTREDVTSVYETALGRAPESEEVIATHLRNPGGYLGFLDTIRTSDEGQGRQDDWRSLLAEGDAPAAGSDANKIAALMSLDERDALQWGNVGKLSGFDTSDYGGDRKARNSMKNTFGRLASHFEASPDGVRALYASAAFKRAFPNAVLLDHETDPKIDFGGQLSDFESGKPVGVVDVLNKSGQLGWQWLDEENDMGGGPVMQMDARPGLNTTNPGMDQRDQLLRALLGEGTEEQISIDALLESLLADEERDPLAEAGLLI